MKIYLDNCAIQRPLDDKSNLRNRIESEAVMGLIELFEQKKIEIVNSVVVITAYYRNLLIPYANVKS